MEHLSVSVPRPRKYLGQHYLVARRILKQIVNAAEPDSQDVVIEIGAGTGNLTEQLLFSARKVIAVELDPRLVQYLRERWPQARNLDIFQQDALGCDWDSWAALYLEPGAKFKLVANLPYYMATPLLFCLAKVRRHFSHLLVMLQREVGERMVASPGSKTYGLLSVTMQYYFTVELLFTVPASAFRPRPKVDSVVMRLVPRLSPPVEVADEGLFFRLLGAAFSYRRKMLANALALGLQIPAAEVAQMLVKLGYSKRVRAEQLALVDFAFLVNLLHQLHHTNKNEPKAQESPHRQVH